MITLIPEVKELTIQSGELATKAILRGTATESSRLNGAIAKLPTASDGATLTVTYENTDGEGYSLVITSDAITVSAESEQGAFWAIQTLRQIFMAKTVPCLTIHDKPDFKYRGFAPF